ncbi:MAG TPA: translation initiation factor [Chitinophagaceae bacterium]|nr:translation initiation factor [Chitinophagaceae bacterium]
MPKKKLYNTRGIVYSTDPEFKTDEEAERTVTAPADEQTLKVRLDAKHRAGKSVTIVEGFIGTASDLENLGKQLKSYCATGGSVKDAEIIIQGDNREKVFQWLIKNGYKKARRV